MDTYAMPRLIDSLNLGNTCFLFISKSGGTAESYAMSNAVLQALRESGIRDFSECCTAITMAGKNPLRVMAETNHIPVITHDPDLCGRFSLLSAVGLLPAAFMGIDIEELLEGAARALHENLKPGSPAAIGAALHYAMQEAGRNISVLMPYSEQLLGLALWWRQGWAESLGKEGQGSTPLVAVGTADQHSQLQLFLGGPDDKFFTLLLTDCAGKGMKLPAIDGPLSYLSNHRLGDLAAAQQRATAETLERHSRPLRVFEIAEADAFTFGALAMHFTLEILFTAALMDANAFDQPAVDESKRLAHEYLTKL
jgi:glucose-6-phosphate isomerase